MRVSSACHLDAHLAAEGSTMISSSSSRRAPQQPARDAAVQAGGSKAASEFHPGGAVRGVAQLAEQVVRKGHAFERRTRLELAMQVGRYIPDLNDRHAMSMLAWGHMST
jgi:hypothetical protein